MPPNQPHRAEIAKLLVAPAARGQGVARPLMAATQNCARAAGRNLPVPDTAAGGDAARLDGKSGWSKAGVIPRYAMFPDGCLCDTVVFWKWLL